MKERQFTKKGGAGILGLVMLIGIGFASATTAQAQSRDDPSWNKDSRNSDSVQAQAYREAELNRRHGGGPRTEVIPVSQVVMLQAKVLVNNHSTREITSVAWVVSFSDPQTGALVATRNVISKSRIAPGKKKTLKKSVPVPRVTHAAAPYRNQARLVSPLVTAKVASVTYADGSTSNTP
ncbi:MAG: hypothetical protein H7Z16_11040 [Pyrinomonadaceae bacterium]|nr:hypothetical protein [Pyrinomonadaceae bacterium]